MRRNEGFNFSGVSVNRSQIGPADKTRPLGCSILKMTQDPQVLRRFRFALLDEIGKKEGGKLHFLSSPDPKLSSCTSADFSVEVYIEQAVPTSQQVQTLMHSVLFLLKF